jgi:formate dehydrogenase beta subunit
MSNPRTFQIQEISAHPGPVPGAGTRREEEVCKYIDVTTCIGCKACEVACVEWNDHPFRETTFDDTYQTMPSTEWNYWNLIKFAEDERDGNLMWLMRKDQCMHCEDPGCLRACPADGAIIKYENGIVDFQQENCIGCGYCISGCPFDIPKFNEKTKKVYKCTLCSDQVGFPLSRIFDADPKGRNAGWTAYLYYGDDQAMARDARRFGARGARSDLFSGNIQYKWNQWVTFAYEQGYYRTRANNRAGLLPLFRGIPSFTTHNVRSEFAAIFTF